jgi:prepilin-type N-terminal cleavage/methylation domain-containing protein
MIFVSRKGFTLIEALIALFIFGIITVTFYAVLSTGLLQIMESRNRLGAIAIANEKMEIVRNLDYDFIGTKKLNGDGSYSYGIPGGDIIEDESIAVNTRNFAVHSFVQYIDDAYDGKASGTTPIDVIPNDYKRVKIEVSWGNGGPEHTVMLVSSFVPKGVEVSSGGGTLSINVIDNAGSGVSQATVHITNSTVNPNIDTTTTTDSTGNLIFPGAKASGQDYRIQASKNGYYGVTTYAPYPGTTFNPTDIHASVVADAFNQKTIIMDKASDIFVATKDVFGAHLPNIDMHISGGRKLGETTDIVPKSVFSLEQDFNSGTDAKKSFTAESSGIYALTFLDLTRYQLLRLNTPDTEKNTFSVLDGAIKNIDATIIDKQNASGLIIVEDATSGTNVPVTGASVHLVNAGVGYDATILTDQYGQAYFPSVLPMLVAGTYDYTVTMSGYADKTGAITITNALTSENVVLTAL